MDSKKTLVRKKTDIKKPSLSKWLKILYPFVGNSEEGDPCSKGRKGGNYVMNQGGHYGSSARTELTDFHLDNYLSKKHKANWKMIIQHRINLSEDNE